MLPSKTFSNPYVCRSCSRLLSSWKKKWKPNHEKVRRYASASSKPFRLAIIGSGPAGFYTASKIMREHNATRIDMYEHLPVPYGLVRYGVAPDHPEVKNCQERFDEVAELPNFDFIGNVNVGYDLPLKDLKPHYDAILFAYGATKDRELGIPGENMSGVYSARDFVAWYNGLPGYTNLNPNLERNGSEAVIIGQGNVALDVARVLLSNVDNLRKTDMPEYALELLSRSKISAVHAVGRRGPMQGAFTIKEVRELATLPNVAFAPIVRDLFPDDLKTLPRARRRLAELLVKSGSNRSGDQKMFSFAFLQGPIKFVGSSQNQLSSIDFQHNEYTEASVRFSPDAAVRALPDSPSINIPASIAFRSIGYKSEPLPGLAGIDIPFDARRGIIPNQLGRVISQSDAGIDVTPPVPGAYVAGWVKRGPTGVIASTMEDAFATADNIIRDLRSGQRLLNHESGGSTGLGWEGIKKAAEQKGLRRTNWRDWRRIDELERERGAKLGKEREKITDVDEMLKVLDR